MAEGMSAAWRRVVVTLAVAACSASKEFILLSAAFSNPKGWKELHFIATR